MGVLLGSLGSQVVDQFTLLVLFLSFMLGRE